MQPGVFPAPVTFMAVFYGNNKSNYAGYNSCVNFLTCHDGFTLYDLYAYNDKHNEANGWDNADGANDNRSWNCGAEVKLMIRKFSHFATA